MHSPLTLPIALSRLAIMEVHLRPETESRLQELASSRRHVGMRNLSFGCDDNDWMRQRVEYRVGSRGHDQWLGGSHTTILATILAVCAGSRAFRATRSGMTLDLKVT